VAGLVSSLTLAGIIAEFDPHWIATDNPLAPVAWLLSVVTGIAAAWFAWTFAAPVDSAEHSDIGNHTMVQCPECGGAVYSEWRLCPHCGARVPEEVVAPAEMVPTR
jgi:DNA-directed RNA polymerase subunit RPC12/RpoP